MKKIWYNDNALLHRGLIFWYYRGVHKSMCEDSRRGLTFWYYRGVYESMLCEDSREAYGYAEIFNLELFLSKELEPLLDENFQVEIEGYGVFSFQHKDWRTNELKRIWRIEDMKQL